MTEKENNTKKENFKVRNILDREGYTETTILEESETIQAVEEWLKKNSFLELMKNEGIVRTGQSYGNRVEVQIDTRDGEILCGTEYPNQYHTADSFFITLASQEEIDISDAEFLEGNSTANLTEEMIKAKIIDSDDEDDFQDFLDRYDIEKEDDGTYIIDYWQAIENNYDISLDSWVDDFQAGEETYEDALNAYLDWVLEDVGKTWQENISEYYDGLRKSQLNFFDD